MAYRSDTQPALDDLTLGRLQWMLKRASANQPQPSEQPEPSADPEEAERWLRWLKISFGCETG